MVYADQRVILKESKKRKEYQDVKKNKLKKLWNIKVINGPILIVPLATDLKDLIKKLEDTKIRGQKEAILTKISKK